MLDLNWETINGPLAHQIERTNAINQANVLTCLIQFLIAHRISPQTLPPPPDEAALLMLHNAGTLLLLASPGQFRNTNVKVNNRRGETTLKPCEWQYVEGRMQTFFRQLHSLWQGGDPLDVAALALWNVNYIHPFRNGNGRTARAFSYACLSVKFGAEPPGTPNIIGLMQIAPHRESYEDLLTATDKEFEQTQRINLLPLKLFLLSLLNIQMQNVPRTPAYPLALSPPDHP